MYLGDFVRSFFWEEISQPDDVNHLAEENEENRDGDTMDARTDGPDRHENVVIGVGEREQLQEGHLLGLLRRTGACFAIDLVRVLGIPGLDGERRVGLGHVSSRRRIDSREREIL